MKKNPSPQVQDCKTCQERKACFTNQDPKIAIPSWKTLSYFKFDKYFHCLCFCWMSSFFKADDELQWWTQRQAMHRIQGWRWWVSMRFYFWCKLYIHMLFIWCWRHIHMFFYNQPIPKKYLDNGLSPLHARCITLFDCSSEEYHQVCFNNRYLYIKFIFVAYSHLKMTVEGMIRTSMVFKGMRLLWKKSLTPWWTLSRQLCWRLFHYWAIAL